MANNFNTCDVALPIIGRNGMTVPTGALDNWRTARAAAGSRLVHIVGWGDSTHQFFSSSNATKGWFGKLCTDLQTLYGDGGSGFISVAETTGLVAGSAGRITASGAGGTGGAGGWDNTIPSGINSTTLFPHVTGSGVTLTFNPVRGTTIDIYWLPVSTGAHFTYNIDGAGAVDVNTQGTTGNVGKTTITGLGAGNHSVVLTATTLFPVIFGMTGRNATGIIGHNMGKAGRVSSDIYTAAASGLNAVETTGKQSIQNFTPDLLLCSVGGINDSVAPVPGPGYFDRPVATGHVHALTAGGACGSVACTGSITHASAASGASSTTPTVYAATANRGYASATRQAANYARAYSANCDIIFENSHWGKIITEGGTVDAGYIAQDYAEALYALGRTFNATTYDLWALGRNSWTYWNSLGYWGDGTNDGLAGTDSVHPSDAGHAAIEAPLLALLSS